MTRDINYVTPNETIEQAAAKMKESNVGDMPVVIGGEAIGMLTDRDITVRITANGLDPQKTHVTDAMTESVVACKEDDDIETVARLMGDKQVRRILISVVFPNKSRTWAESRLNDHRISKDTSSRPLRQFAASPD
jgi:CBS domain-containing protein